MPLARGLQVCLERLKCAFKRSCSCAELDPTLACDMLHATLPHHR